MIKSHLLKRVFYQCWDWEDFKAGMYKGKVQDESLFYESKNLFLNPKELRKAMLSVCNEWPISTEYNLANTGRNRRAWLGRSSNCLHHNATENTVRIVWRSLTEEEKARANEIAESVINEWEMEYFKNA